MTKRSAIQKPRPKSLVKFLMTPFFVVLLATAVCKTQAATFARGDIFVSVGSGQVKWYDGAGSFKMTLDTTTGGFTAGSAFDSAGNFYVTDLSAHLISKFDNTGTLLGTFGGGYSEPESILFDAAGNAYVGNLAGPIQKFDAAGNLVASFSVGSAGWIELAADQCTMFFTSGGTSVERFDVCNNIPLAPFATGLPGSQGFALRLLPDGELLVADSEEIVRLDAGGNFSRGLVSAVHSHWTALDLDPDGTSFWGADFGTGDVFKFDITTLARWPLLTPAQAATLFSVSLFLEERSHARSRVPRTLPCPPEPSRLRAVCQRYDTITRLLYWPTAEY